MPTVSVEYTDENCERLARYIVGGWDLDDLVKFAIGEMEADLKAHQYVFDGQVENMELTQEELNRA